MQDIVLPEKEDANELQMAFSSESGVYEVSSDGTEPPRKRARTDILLSERDAMIIKQVMNGIAKAVSQRLDAIDAKVEGICINSKYLEDKLEQLMQNSATTQNSPKSLLNLESDSSNMDNKDEMNLVEEVTMSGDIRRLSVITLNRAEDYPHGSWLGDETRPEMRVRVGIAPDSLLHINSNCQTSMKMALTLLDYLFDRDTLAASNLSGHSKLGKRQLDPLLIYGIRCHLVHRFGITDDEWKHIKLNMDSKCRTAFRRKMLGMPLTVKAFRGKVPSIIPSSPGVLNAEYMPSEESLQRVDADIIPPELMLMNPGRQNIHWINATPEQLSQINIKLIKEEQELQESENGAELFSPETTHDVICLVKANDIGRE